ncbi:UxaA family hydrolase [Parafilimonas terrae]|uniref:Altronate hydrolase n=1 Tax=Parafilimonas terrae TaxID=1465490 RepID=A0A1I5TQ72_9BACT|nr:altronate dehydratase family protein [Parafilimonas terrae]SFP85185.1 altronate hydrolase [Parafilimonas terrae]
MKHSVLKIHPADNVLVALRDIKQGETIQFKEDVFLLKNDVPAKHKFTTTNLQKGDVITMYGITVGKAVQDIERGSRISTENIVHATDAFHQSTKKNNWVAPDVSNWQHKTFMGYHRSNGSVGTANYWLVVPMVFCENRNVEKMKEAMLEELGYKAKGKYSSLTHKLKKAYVSGKDFLADDFNIDVLEEEDDDAGKLFSNIDGIKFLTHTLGCGGIRQDANTLCGLLAGYITHPNVAGATVLSLGCQNAEVKTLEAEIAKRDAGFNKPLFILDQQQTGKGSDFISLAIKQTFRGLAEANKITRQPASINKLIIGLECGGSDGFSGISANPAIGYTSDILVTCGGAVILSEFPELCGVEQEISERCTDEKNAERFMHLMKTYNQLAENAGSGFYMNPSPGNIKDGLITDAIKSAGASKKGGSSPVVDVLDYPQKVNKQGLNLLCTPGNDVESTTAEVAAGANIVLFTTGLGTPTGNPVTPVIKISSNTKLYNRMQDIIDINAGTIIEGEETIEEAGERILDYVIKVASGDIKVCAVKNEQDDFIPWKRGVSL